MNHRHCEECKEVLRGRIDQRFCSDPCRNSWHNRSKREENQTLARINARLRRNRKILLDLSFSGQLKIAREYLLHQGFDFSYFTRLIQNEDGAEVRYCYELAYYEESDGYCVLIKEMSDP